MSNSGAVGERLMVVLAAQEAVIIGGLDMQTQAKALAQRPHVVVATPGRLRVGAESPWPVEPVNLAAMLKWT